MDGISSISIVDSAFEALDNSWPKKKLYSREIGQVESVGEGIARISGLPNVQADELVSFQNGALGLTYNLDPHEVGVILLDEDQGIEAGNEVQPTGKLLGVPVGEALLGRMVDALGRPIDDKGDIPAQGFYPVERPAPAIIDRAPVQAPLNTGVMPIDAMIPIGRGQRELILGDRQTGKTAIAVDAIINQKGQDAICIYCAIGKQRASINRVVSDLRKNDALDFTIVVSASSSTPTGLQYVAPYAATSMAEYFMGKGQDVLIIYDDLTWHARAYRELALLLRRPPGREAYPGDIFYIHARLLERSARLKDELGGGSITALPIIETQAQDLSAFIPTNLISITDGQIYLSPVLFQKDVLPAIDVGKSVSRVGGAAQLKSYREVAKELKLSYSQFEEIESFARFSSRLDEHTRSLIERGKRIREVLKQPQFDPLPVPVQIELLRAVNEGLFDSVEVDKVPVAKQIVREEVRNFQNHLGMNLSPDLLLTDQQKTALHEKIVAALSTLDSDTKKEKEVSDAAS